MSLLLLADPAWKPTVDSIIEVLRVVRWPVVVSGVVLFLASGRGRRLLTGVVGRVRKVSAGGFSLELTDASAPALKADLEATFRDYREQVNIGFDLINHLHRVPSLRDRVARDVIRPNLSHGKFAFKCTVYVPDILFADALYCLLNYFPRGTARGRVFSVRFGIIGKSWRQDKSELKQDVPGNREHLIKEWGMTSDEADEQRPQALLCYILRVDGERVGLLFVEAESNSFAPNICDLLEQAACTQKLANAVETAAQEMRKRGPVLKIL
jgi:hypothetical protein